jgi:hypothetical protein
MPVRSIPFTSMCSASQGAISDAAPLSRSSIPYLGVSRSWLRWYALMFGRARWDFGLWACLWCRVSPLDMGFIWPSRPRFSQARGTFHCPYTTLHSKS